MGSSRWPLKVRLHLSISTALMRPRRPKQYCLQLDIALWCKNQIEHSIWDESLLFSNCARSLEYSSSSTLAGLSYHICGKLEVAFKGSPSSQHQHCTDEAQKAETVLSAVSYIYIYIYIYECRRIYIYIYIYIHIDKLQRSLEPTAHLSPQRGSLMDSQSKPQRNVINYREFRGDQGRTTL